MSCSLKGQRVPHLEKEENVVVQEEVEGEEPLNFIGNNLKTSKKWNTQGS